MNSGNVGTTQMKLSGASVPGAFRQIQQKEPYRSVIQCVCTTVSINFTLFMFL